jgi:transposase
MSKNSKRLTKASNIVATAQAGKEPAQSIPLKQPVLSVIKDIGRQTRKQYSAEEKIRIVLEGLRGESSVAEICRREGINTNIYYRWSKEFLEAGKKRLMGNTIREAYTHIDQLPLSHIEKYTQLIVKVTL